MEQRIVRQPDIVWQCEDFIKYMAYDQATGTFIYQYDFKQELHAQIIQNCVPRDLYIDMALSKQNLPILYTPMRPGTQLLTILQREAASPVKIPQQLIQQWVDGLIEDCKVHLPQNPRLDYVMLDAALGRVYFDIQAYLPMTNVAEKFEKNCQIRLAQMPQVQHLLKWLRFLYDVQYGAAHVQLVDEAPYAGQEPCRQCKNFVYIYKLVMDTRTVTDSMNGPAIKKMYECMLKYSSQQHAEQQCQIMRLVLSDGLAQPPATSPKFVFPTSSFGNSSVRLCYTVCSMLCKNIKPIQNFLQVMQVIDIEFDLYEAIEGLDKTSKKIAELAQRCFLQKDLKFEQFNDIYLQTRIRVLYKNKRDFSQNMVIHIGNQQKCLAIVKEPLDEIIKSVQEELDGVLAPDVAEQILRDNPPTW